MCALGAAAAGWLLASTPEVDPSATLEWHRWIALLSTGAALIAAACSVGTEPSESRLRVYRVFLFASAAGIGPAAHFGATLVWGAHFLHF